MMQPFTHPLLGDTLYYGQHPSGLAVYVWPRPQARSTYGVFATRYGSVHNVLPTPDGGIETVPEGIAHYLEHKLFESEDGDAFTRYAATGADANAYTGFNRTAYLFQATENVLPSLEILLDFVQHPYFTEETVQKEQGIIGQEIRMCEDDPGRNLLFNMLRGLYHRHPVRVEIAGTVPSIARITPDLLYRCYNRYYNLHNMMLVVSGPIAPETVWEAANRLLKPAADWQPMDIDWQEPDGVVEQEVEAVMPVAAPLFYLGLKEPAGERDPKDMAGANLLLELLIGKGSPLYTRLLTEGLINDAFSAEYFNGPGFGIWLFGGESAEPRRVRDLLLEEIARQQRQGIDRAAFEAVRRGAYGRLVAQLEDPENCAEILLDDLTDGLPPLSRLEALAAITPEELEEQLRRRMAVGAHTLSVVRPA